MVDYWAISQRVRSSPGEIRRRETNDDGQANDMAINIPEINERARTFSKELIDLPNMYI
jgi:hypothetical protein